VTPKPVERGWYRARRHSLPRPEREGRRPRLPGLLRHQRLGGVGLSSADHTAIDAGINDLDGVIQTAAASNNATFADVRAQFSGHELCDSSGWLHSLNILDISESYHPTAAGQSSGYLPVFSTAAASVGQ
jgi:hypothetical protein